MRFASNNGPHKSMFPTYMNDSFPLYHCIVNYMYYYFLKTSAVCSRCVHVQCMHNVIFWKMWWKQTGILASLVYNKYTKVNLHCIITPAVICALLTSCNLPLHRPQDSLWEPWDSCPNNFGRCWRENNGINVKFHSFETIRISATFNFHKNEWKF